MGVNNKVQFWSLTALLQFPVTIGYCEERVWYRHYQLRYSGSTEEATENSFLKYVQDQIGAVKRCVSKGNTERDCALYFETFGSDEEKVFFHADQILRGMYSIYAEVWLRHFPRNNIMFIQSEEYFADEGAVLKKVFESLGLGSETSKPKQ
eukprot:gene14847-20901_t